MDKISNLNCQLCEMNRINFHFLNKEYFFFLSVNWMAIDISGKKKNIQKTLLKPNANPLPM